MRARRQRGPARALVRTTAAPLKSTEPKSAPFKAAGGSSVAGYTSAASLWALNTVVNTRLMEGRAYTSAERYCEAVAAVACASCAVSSAFTCAGPL